MNYLFDEQTKGNYIKLLTETLLYQTITMDYYGYYYN